MLSEWNCNVVCFCETWLTSTSTCDSFLAIDGFSFFRRDRPNDRRGGGLLVYVNRELQPTRRLDLENPEIECLTLELNGPSPLNPCFLFFCYRPPNFPLRLFFKIFQLTSPPLPIFPFSFSVTLMPGKNHGTPALLTLLVHTSGTSYLILA